MAKTVRVVVLTSKKKGRKQTGKGTKKYGRNKVKCAKYRAEGRREKNKARKAKKLQKLMAKKAARRQ